MSEFNDGVEACAKWIESMDPVEYGFRGLAKAMRKELVRKEGPKAIDIEPVINLLASGDDTGCDGLVVVGLEEFLVVRKLIHDITGFWEGSIDQEEETEP